MMKIYGRDNSVNVQKVIWTLGELNHPYERLDVGRQFGFPEGYEALNFNKLVPVMDDAGFILWESNAIVRYLARKYGAGSLAPNDLAAYADADRWMDWGSATFYGAFGPGFVQLYRMPEDKRDLKVVEDSFHKTVKVATQLDHVLAGRDYITGSQFTMADIIIGLCAHRWVAMPYRETIGQTQPPMPNIERYFARLQTRPVFKQHIDSPLS